MGARIIASRHRLGSLGSALDLGSPFSVLVDGPWWTLVDPGVILGSFSGFVSKWYCKESVSLFHSETKQDHAINRMVKVAMVFQQLLI